jgi:hypothetical protein
MAGVTFTPAKAARLRKRYEQAVRDGEDQFTFEGNEILVSYAAYMLEHLDQQFHQATATWRGSKQLRGVRSRLQAALNACTDGAWVELDIKTAKNLIEVCNQAIHTEEGHGT